MIQVLSPCIDVSKRCTVALASFLSSPGPKYFAFVDALAEARRKYSGRMFFYIIEENILKEVKYKWDTHRCPVGGTRSLTLSLHIVVHCKDTDNFIESKQYEQNFLISKEKQPLYASYRRFVGRSVRLVTMGSHLFCHHRSLMSRTQRQASRMSMGQA